MRTTSIILLAAVALAAVSMVAAQVPPVAVTSIHLKPANQRVHTNEPAKLFVKAIGADGKPAAGVPILFAVLPADANITTARQEMVWAAQGKRATDQFFQDTTTNAKGHASVTFTSATAGQFVALASWGVPPPPFAAAANKNKDKNTPNTPVGRTPIGDIVLSNPANINVVEKKGAVTTIPTTP